MLTGHFSFEKTTTCGGSINNDLYLPYIILTKKVAYAEATRRKGSETRDTICYETRFNCGMPSTKSVKSIIEQQGSEKIYLHSTISDDKNKITRDLNSFKFGFNQKLYTLLGRNSHISFRDYSIAYNISTFKFSENSRIVPYGMVENEFMNLTFLNSDSYNSMNVKIHGMEIDSNRYTVNEVYNRIFNKDVNEKQEAGAIPINYQIKNKISSTLVHYATVVPKCTLTSSEFFKNNLKVLKSFDYKLNPGVRLD